MGIMEFKTTKIGYRRRSNFENYTGNNPFLMDDDSNGNGNETAEEAVPVRRFSLQQSFSRKETEHGSETIKQSRIQMEGIYAAGEGSRSHSTVVQLDSLGNSMTQRWCSGRDFVQNDDKEKSISTLVTYNSCDDTNENDDLFLVPEDLKQAPNKISVMLSQSMTVLAQINNQDVLEKVCAGGHIAKQMVVGNVVGYCTAHVVRKFGKLAAGSIIGSFCFIKLAHHRGYISVDWKRIQKQIESPQQEDTDTNDGVKHDDIAWLSKKIHQIREWSKENTFTVIGFCTGFAINNLNL
ncbi:unnamed protein product [Allacma fusca]|uniref:FUN14 domain-containing protein 1 n=1 Tax=Allacma fusca TaxID=39272 RepID=A0A8J2JGU7_9HEXA|nr:unnamed protein product [Allacma fusca]